jgi:glyceraldehyde-3-phosphate dehydrogenase (NAD(P))
MSKIKVGVAGYGVIGQRLADGVALQGDMELVGVADVAPTLAVLSLKEKGMPYRLFCAVPDKKKDLEDRGIPVAGNMEELVDAVDVMLDATTGGVGMKNKQLYKAMKTKAIFQGGEKNDVADVFFHGYANYEKGVGKDYLKLTSCNTTGLIRAVDSIDRAVGVDKVAITIIRRVADPGDTHRGLVDTLMVDKVPNHQCVDLMLIMPHIDATGFLVHTPVTHGHIINLVVTPKKDFNCEDAVKEFEKHPRIRVVSMEDGFNSNTAFFRYARDLGRPRGDMYEIGVWRECMGMSKKDIMFAINIPQESVVIPETMDGIRAVMEIQTDRLEAVAATNKYLGMS